MNIMLQEGAKAPVKATKRSSCYDMFSLETVVIPPGCYKKINTGVHVEMPSNIEGTVTHRSGMNSKQGAFALGRIDPDYRGLISVTLFNLDPSKEIRVDYGERFAQIKFAPFWSPELNVVQELTNTERGEGGHGSTGRR